MGLRFNSGASVNALSGIVSILLVLDLMLIIRKKHRTRTITTITASISSELLPPRTPDVLERTLKLFPCNVREEPPYDEPPEEYERVDPEEPQDLEELREPP